MKKKYFSIIAFSLVLVMLILATGCGVRVNGKEYEMFSASKDFKEDLSFSIGSESSKTAHILQDKLKGEQLVVSDNTGNIKIGKSTDSLIRIKADRRVRGASSDDKKKILENMIFELERNGKVIKVVVKTDAGDDFWDWQKENYKAFQITINFDISLPEGINVLEVSTGAGNIDINDVSSRLSLSTGAGNIDIKDVAALQDNSLSTGAGNIDFEGDIDNASSFEASTGAGNIKFEVPEESKMSLKADTGIGLLSGSFIKSKDNSKFHFVGDINGGGSTVDLNTGVGNIKADAK